jgi:methionine biosynthesis protein MetW
MTHSIESNQLSGTRLASYTGVRADIYGLVPIGAKNIIDLGCSDGSLGAALKAQVPGRVVSGLEYSTRLAELAKTRLDQVMQVDLNQTTALDALAGQQFDCAICADVLEHLQQPEQLLRLLRRLLSPSACLIVSLPNIRHISALYSIFVSGSFPRRQRGIFDDTHWRWFTLKDGRNLLADAGFQIEKIDYSLRWGDQGGGRANRILIRSIGPFAHRLPFVKEFLTYQFAMRTRLDGASAQ